MWSASTSTRRSLRWSSRSTRRRRSTPCSLPARVPVMPEKRTRGYMRHGTTATLFAALNTTEGSAICDNYRTHTTSSVKAWLEKHPRFHTHFTSTFASWINEVERFFGVVSDNLLRRSDHRSVHPLQSNIEARVKVWNETCVHSSGRRRSNRSSCRWADF